MLAVSAFVAGACFLLGAALTQAVPDGTSKALRLPIAWVVLPFPGWMAIVCLVVAAVRGIQSSLALPGLERTRFLKSVGGWAAAGAIGVYWFNLDPTNKATLLRGSIPIAVSTAISFVLFAIAAVAAMTWASKGAASQGFAKGLCNYVVLIAGAVVFGLPFAFLLVTSFKEDQDMVSPNGIVWIPKVKEQVPFFDAKHPIYEGTYQGETVEGQILEDHGDSVKIDITKPFSIRGVTFEAKKTDLKVVPKMIDLVTATAEGQVGTGMVVEELEDGHRRVRFLKPDSLKGREQLFAPTEIKQIRKPGLRWQNYSEALSFLPPETNKGLVYLKNTMLLVILNILGAICSSSVVAYAFSRLRFPGREFLFKLLLSTMMLPAAVTLLPQFLIFRSLGWIDTLYPLFVPAFFASAFNVFLLRQFFMSIPLEYEDAAKIDGCSYVKTFWNVMLPQIRPALAVISVMTFLATWNNFMGPLIYINSPENMPLSYALQLFMGDRLNEPGLMMAFATMSLVPVLLLFFFAQRYFIESVQLSGLGGR